MKRDLLQSEANKLKKSFELCKVMQVTESKAAGTNFQTSYFVITVGTSDLCKVPQRMGKGASLKLS